MSLDNPLVLVIFATYCLHMNTGQDTSSSPQWMVCWKSLHLYPKELALFEKERERGRIHLNELNTTKTIN